MNDLNTMTNADEFKSVESIGHFDCKDDSANIAQTADITFEDLGLDEIALKAVERKGFTVPTPIQILAIPRLLTGDANVIARARTGTGKTAAFGLPLTQRMREQSGHVRAIILEPTRELAVQTCVELQSLTQGRYPRTCVVYGGSSYSTQIRDLRHGVEIVVGTPGRVQDHLNRGTLDISKIDYFILDEGDEMLDMGFIDDIENIFKAANKDCRVLLFSATVPPPILKVAQKFMGEYEIVEEGGITSEPLLIEQHYWIVREREKINALVRLIDITDDFYGLVFTQTKNDADSVCRALDERGYDAAALHGDVPQGQREKILARFRERRTRVLVATDVAARGIDITGLSHVVNYSLPFDGATYVHRIGRTGRAGAQGAAITFVRPEEKRRLRYIESAIHKASKGTWSPQVVPQVDAVLRRKKERIFAALKDSVKKAASNASNTDSEKAKSAEGSSTLFDDMAKELCEGEDEKSIISALLKVMYKGTFDRSRYGEITSVNIPSAPRDRMYGRGTRDEHGRWARRGEWVRQDREQRTSGVRKERQGRTFDDRRQGIPFVAERKTQRSKGSFGESRADKFLYGGYAHEQRAGGNREHREDARPSGKARPNVHTPTERSGSPGLYRQKHKAKERF